MRVIRPGIENALALHAPIKVRVEPKIKKLVWTHFTGESSAARSEMVCLIGSYPGHKRAESVHPVMFWMGPSVAATTAQIPISCIVERYFPFLNKSQGFCRVEIP